MVNLDYNQQEFVANGKTYHVSDSMPAQRYWMYQKMRMELLVGANYGKIYESYDTILSLINRFVRGEDTLSELFVYIDSVKKGMSDLDKKHPIELYLCTLFVNRNGEDTSKWSPDLAKEKIEDWNEEKINTSFFLNLAIGSLSNLLQDYNTDSQSTTQ